MEQNIEAALSTLKEKCDDLATINVLYADRVSALEKENKDLKAKLKLANDKHLYYEDILKMANDNYDCLLTQKNYKFNNDNNKTPSFMIPIYIVMGFTMMLLAYTFIR